MMAAVCNQKSIAAVYHYYGQDVLMVCEWVLKRKALHDKGHIRCHISSTMCGAKKVERIVSHNFALLNKFTQNIIRLIILKV